MRRRGREHGTRVGATEMPGEEWRSGAVRGRAGFSFHALGPQKISPYGAQIVYGYPGTADTEMPGEEMEKRGGSRFRPRRKTSMRVPQLIRVCFTLLYRYCCVPVSGWYICVPFNLHKFVYGV